MLKVKGVSGTHFKGGSRVFWCQGDGGKGRDLVHFRAVKKQPQSRCWDYGGERGSGLVLQAEGCGPEAAEALGAAVRCQTGGGWGRTFPGASGLGERTGERDEGRD